MTAEKLHQSKIGVWLVEHRDDLVNEAKRRETNPDDFVIEMLEDALEAYKNGEVDDSTIRH